MASSRLYEITVIQGGEFATQSEEKQMRTLKLKGTRGQITDITGIPLAYDQSSYNVEFTRDPSKNTSTDLAWYTDILIRAIKLIEQNGQSIIDTFAIKKDEAGNYYFDFGVQDEEAFAKREKNWRKNMAVSDKAPVDAIYRELRTRYRIPEEYTYEQARKLLSIWQEVRLSSYLAYVPVKIATNIDIETVAVLEANMADLEGIGVSESSMRIYPKDSVAAHIIGYTGKMTEKNTIDEMKAYGYTSDDLIGITGIESTMEKYLTGNSTERQGEKKVVVNSKGKVIQELSYEAPKAGNNVVLSLDLDLQMFAEEALEANVQSAYEYRMQKYETATEKQRQTYDEQLGSKGVNQQKTGAVVVMDVKTGKILAMASYPSYDINLFSGGISEEDLEMLNNDKAKPMFNNAVSSKAIPGSIFKMVTGMGGLMEGSINVNTTIDDKGLFDKYLGPNVSEAERNKAPSCWAYKTEPKTNVTKHSGLNLRDAIKVSCNYFFYETATRMGDDKLVHWAEQFGLTTLTGIELTGEVAGQVGSQEVLYDPTKEIKDQKTPLPNLIQVSLMKTLKEYGTKRDIEYTEDQLKATAQRLMKLVGAVPSNEQGPHIRAILSEELGIPETITSAQGWTIEISQRLLELTWNDTRTAVAGIGSDITAVTPIAVARYISALINGGTVYEASIVDRIVDNNGQTVEVREPQVLTQIDAPAEYFNQIKLGMKDVVSSEEDGGSASGEFEELEKKGYTVGGKTGTGKVSKAELENNAWFVAFAPYDDPEIAVVSYIPNGVMGKQAVPVGRDIIEYYLDGKQEKPERLIPSSNSALQ